MLSESSQGHLNTFALYLLYCTALLCFSNPAMGEATLKLFLCVCLITMLCKWQETLRNPALYLLLLSIGVQYGSWEYSQQHHPQYAEARANLKYLGAIFLFIPIAWTLRQNNRQPWFLVMVFLIGLCLTPFVKGHGFEEFAHYRSKFGTRNPQHAALLFAIALLGLTVFAKRILQINTQTYRTTIILLATAMAFCLSVLVATNTRGVILGLLLALMPALVFYLRRREQPIDRRIVLVLLSLGLMVVVIFMSSEQLRARWYIDSPTISAILHGDLNKIPDRTNSGIRIHSWVEGWKWFLESPIIGWGANGRTLVVEQSDALPIDIRFSFGHLHNSFIEILVNYGILGALLLVLTYGWLWRTIMKRARYNHDENVRLFLASFGVLWITANCFEPHIFFKTGMMVFGIVMGALLSIGNDPEPDGSQHPHALAQSE